MNYEGRTHDVSYTDIRSVLEHGQDFCLKENLQNIYLYICGYANAYVEK